MAHVQFGIIGLGRVGASVGMALRQASSAPGAANTFTVRGYDPDVTAANAAQRDGAVDSLARSAADAVAGQDAVLLAGPVHEARDTLRAIAPALRADVVLLDAFPAKTRAIAWGRELLPPGVHLVGVTLVVNGAFLHDDPHTAPPSAELVRGGALVLAPAPHAAPDAVAFAASLAEEMGARAHFVDADEHDGLLAATENLPLLLALAALDAVSHGSAWTEAQRLANPTFAAMTRALHGHHPDALRDQLLHNRDNTVRQLDATLAALGALREALAANDRDSLEAVLEDAARLHSTWLARRAHNTWDDTPPGGAPAREPRADIGSTIARGLLGGYLLDRLRGAGKRGKQP